MHMCSSPSSNRDTPSAIQYNSVLVGEVYAFWCQVSLLSRGRGTCPIASLRNLQLHMHIQQYNHPGNWEVNTYIIGLLR